MTRTLLFTLSFLLVACGSDQPSSSASAIPGDMPTNEILVYRPASEAAETIFARPAIMVNENNIGDCEAGKPLLIRLPEGRWTVTAITASDSVAQEVRVNDFDAVYFRCGTTGGFTPTLTRVTRAVAEAEGGI